MSLTTHEIRCLAYTPFNGLRPGDNLWPDVALVSRTGRRIVDGSVVSDLILRGYLAAEELPAGKTERHDEGFEVEYRWRYRLTEEGRAALASSLPRRSHA